MDDFLATFFQLLKDNTAVSFWKLNQKLEILETNAVHPTLFSHLLLAPTIQKALRRHFTSGSVPMVLNDYLGLSWFICTCPSPVVSYYIYGPILSQNITYDQMEYAFLSLHTSEHLAQKALKAMRDIPKIPQAAMLTYLGMTNQFLNHTVILSSDFYYENMEFISKDVPVRPPVLKHNNWGVHHELMRMIREGNVQYHSILHKASIYVDMSARPVKDPLRVLKNSLIVFTSQCAAAAMEGGITQETAYTLRDHHIQLLEQCSTYGQAANASRDMYDSFVRLVHAGREYPAVSHPIQQCLEYINLSADSAFSLSDLSDSLGYSAYYLSRKFKNETGMSVQQYTRKRRIEQAKLLLRTTDLPVAQISDTLHFCNIGYFSKIFTKDVGMSPRSYRYSKTP